MGNSPSLSAETEKKSSIKEDASDKDISALKGDGQEGEGGSGRCVGARGASYDMKALESFLRAANFDVDDESSAMKTPLLEDHDTAASEEAKEEKEESVSVEPEAEESKVKNGQDSTVSVGNAVEGEDTARKEAMKSKDEDARGLVSSFDTPVVAVKLLSETPPSPVVPHIGTTDLVDTFIPSAEQVVDAVLGDLLKAAEDTELTQEQLKREMNSSDHQDDEQQQGTPEASSHFSSESFKTDQQEQDETEEDDHVFTTRNRICACCCKKTCC